MFNKPLPEWKDLTIPKKTSKAYELKFTENGQYVDITDWTIYFTVKASMNNEDSEALIAKEITSHLDATGGKSLIELTSTDTNISAGIYYYSIDYKDDDGNVKILYQGKLRISKTVLNSRS